jgi:hypothetical protein
LIDNATALTPRNENACWIGTANPAIFNDPENGRPEGDITPDNRNTATLGTRLENGHIAMKKHPPMG